VSKLKSIPSVVQLPGGVRLNAIPFRIASWHEDGSPHTFELMPPGTPITVGLWALFADETALRALRKP
jgi:hypothetical protein